MTREELREKVATKFRELTAAERLEHWPLTWEELADAAIALVLEEAAKVADRYQIPMCETSASHIAAAIRALKGNP